MNVWMNIQCQYACTYVGMHVSLHTYAYIDEYTSMHANTNKYECNAYSDKCDEYPFIFMNKYTYEYVCIHM